VSESCRDVGTERETVRPYPDWSVHREGSAVRNAVVTGGAGFLGSHLCERLLSEDYRVQCLDDFTTGTPHNVAHLLENPAFRLVRTDVTGYIHVGGRVDAVLHFASPASPVEYLQMPIHTLKVGSIRTLHALGLARSKAADSCWRRPQRCTATRRCILNPSRTGDAGIVRIFNTFGERMRPDDARAVPNLHSTGPRR